MQFISVSRTDEETKVILTAWNDNTVVTVGSISYGSSSTSMVQRFSRADKKKIDVVCPDVVRHYNSTMGGVDRMDSNVAIYRTSIRGKKWYFPLFIELLDVAMNNAWLLYRLCGNARCDQNSFKSSVSESLLSLNTTKRSNPPTCTSTVRYDGIGHLVDSTVDSKEMRCAQCQGKTRYQCIKCKRALHPKTCFLTYHSI